MRILSVFFINLFFLCSCTSTYQVFEVSSKELSVKNTNLVFENRDVSITYNFWEEGGKVYFLFTNKTDSDIYIDWDKSHLIYNGISYDYWHDIEDHNQIVATLASSSSYSNSNMLIKASSNNIVGKGETASSSIGKKITAITSTKYRPKKIINIPPKASILVSKFSISKLPFFNCEFNIKGMNPKAPRKLNFLQDNTPVNFRNYITYATDEKFTNKTSIDNHFYISSISFVSQKLFNGNSLSNKECTITGAKKVNSFFEFPYKNPAAFYIVAKRQ